MSRFSDLARLKKAIRKKRFQCIGSTQEGIDFMCDAETAMPWLLRIAEAFQPGDMQLLTDLSDIIGVEALNEDTEESTLMHQAAACLRRLRKAAEEMER